MIPRYALPRMAKVWDPEHRFDLWLKIEVLACEAWAEQGKIPEEALKVIQERAGYEITRVHELEKETKHEVVAFLRAVAERVGGEARYIHMGLTSSDLMDTTLAVQLKEASELLIEDVEKVLVALKELALKHKTTPMIGRTHGVHAEPITFGLKLATWSAELQRGLERLQRAKEIISFGKLSGAVGTFAHLPPSIESYVLDRLGLHPEPASSQVIPRDRHADYLAALALVGSSLDRFATEIRHLQRTEVLEVEEPFTEGQTGSSAMPHKRNPVSCEQLSGLARILRANVQAALENIPLWHERDISHSSVERVILPDSTILLDYMLQKFLEILEGLRVYPGRMRRNLDRSFGLIFSEQVLLALIDKGASREEAYTLVQRNAMRAWEEEVSGGLKPAPTDVGEGLQPSRFQRLLLQDDEVIKYLSREEVEACFDLDVHFKHVDHIFERVGLV
ncbi:MAG: adenylosuccinate lyase [candidate division NC10 bacterium]|nr:adenylosuccinate lyase [candidate division NC10 bacterium]